MHSNLKYFSEIIIVALICGCVFSPYASALALLVISAAKLLERYFTRNISDDDRKDIQSLKSDHQKLKDKVDKEGLAKAFSRG